MANIRFNIDRKNTGYIFVIYDIRPGHRFKMSVQEKVSPAQWDATRQAVTEDHTNHVYINGILHNIRTEIEKARVESKYRGKSLTKEYLSHIINRIIRPSEPSPMNVRNVSRDLYFQRFYEIVGNYLNLQDAYNAVESEFNEAGVEMFANYGAFRVAKTRYFNKMKKSSRKVNQ